MSLKLVCERRKQKYIAEFSYGWSIVFFKIYGNLKDVNFMQTTKQIIHLMCSQSIYNYFAIYNLYLLAFVSCNIYV